MLNSLNPDQAQQNFVEPDLGPNCLQWLLAGKGLIRCIISCVCLTHLEIMYAFL